MSKFKVGDKVRVLTTHVPKNVPNGSIQTVLHIREDRARVTGDNNNNNNERGWTFDDHELELVTEAKDMNQEIEVGDIINGLSYNNNRVVSIHDNHYYVINLGEEKQGDAHPFVVTKRHAKLVSKGNKMKEIIGYKLKDNKYKDSALHVINREVFGTDNPKGVDIMLSSNIAKYKELGVLDIWFEPVYKSTEVVVKLSGNRTATIVDKTKATINMAGYIGGISASDVAFTLEAFNSLGQIAGYNVGIKEFNLGCQTFTIDDLIAVSKAFTDFK